MSMTVLTTVSSGSPSRSSILELGDFWYRYLHWMTAPRLAWTGCGGSIPVSVCLEEAAAPYGRVARAASSSGRESASWLLTADRGTSCPPFVWDPDGMYRRYQSILLLSWRAMRAFHRATA